MTEPSRDRTVPDRANAITPWNFFRHSFAIGWSTKYGRLFAFASGLAFVASIGGMSIVLFDLQRLPKEVIHALIAAAFAFAFVVFFEGAYRLFRARAHDHLAMQHHLNTIHAEPQKASRPQSVAIKLTGGSEIVDFGGTYEGFDGLIDADSSKGWFYGTRVNSGTCKDAP